MDKKKRCVSKPPGARNRGKEPLGGGQGGGGVGGTKKP